MGRKYRETAVGDLARRLATGQAKDRCRGKRRFASRSAAERFIERARRLFPGQGLHPYLCPDCHGWHTTTKEGE